MPNIYQNSVTDRMLGCLFQNPMLCLETKYKLDKDEFKANKFHQILYVTIYNLACSDYKTISIFDINSFLEPYTSQYEIYKDNNGDSYIDTIIELTDTSNFEAYYNENIINYCEGLQTSISKEFYPKERELEEIQAGFGLEELKEKLQEEPL